MVLIYIVRSLSLMFTVCGTRRKTWHPRYIKKKEVTFWIT